MQQNHNHGTAKQESSSPRRPGGDRLKRDEWSEGAVSSLLEAYESKWVLRNRAKLKGLDWEEVARHVSSRGDSSKSSKTQTQCKNKIESMKKRYRSESAGASSSWPLFSRLHHLMRGAPPSPSVGPTPVVLLESLPAPQPPPPPPAPPPPTLDTAQSSPNSNCADQLNKEERVVSEEAKVSDQESDRNKNAVCVETDSSTPALYGSKDTRSKPSSRVKKAEKRKRRRVSGSGREDVDVGIAQSIQLLAEAVVRSEQVRMETMRDLERMRVEADNRRGEMDLKRTEIIASTQLEIARIFAACASSAAKNCT